MARRGWVRGSVRLLGFGLCLGVASGSAVVARVGPTEITADAVERRLSRLAPFQLRQLGQSWPEQRRRLLERVLIPEALLELAAREAPSWPSPRDVALAHALRFELLQQASAAALPESEIAAYHAQFRRHYEQPKSLLIWRIEVGSRAAAKALIRELGTPDEAEFRRLARERSLDSATRMRGGSLGYVARDGQTHMPQVRVDPSLFAAAERVGDGELVAEPVPEGSHFAVVWRRASSPERRWTAAQLHEEIRARLVEQKAAQALQRLIGDLRVAHLRDHAPAPLEGFEPRFPERVTRREPPQPEAPAARSPRLTPQPTDRGLR